MNIQEGRTGGNQSAAIRSVKNILGNGFGLGSGIRKRKDDGPRTLAPFRERCLDWHQYRDPEGSIQRTFGIHAFPTYIVIDPEGIVRQKIVGENPQQSIVARLKSVLATLTAEKGKA